MGRERSTHTDKRTAYRVLVGEPEGKRPLGRSRRRWDDNIRINLEETACGGANWIHLAENGNQWRDLVSMVMNLRAP
jgi:hypothetical protein